MTSNVSKARGGRRTRLTTTIALSFLATYLFAYLIQPAAGATVQITSPSEESVFYRGDSVPISGQIEPAEGGRTVGITVKDAGGTVVYIEEATTGSDGTWTAPPYNIRLDARAGRYEIKASAGDSPAYRHFYVRVEVTVTATITVTLFHTATLTAVETVSGDTTLQTLITVLSVTTVTTPTTVTSLLPSYTTSTTTVTVAKSTTTASVQVTEISAGTSITVTQIVVIVNQTQTYTVETLTSSSTEVRTTTMLVPGTTETQHGTTSQTTYAIETTKTVDYLLVALAFATPALLLAWALILLRRRY